MTHTNYSGEDDSEDDVETEDYEVACSEYDEEFEKEMQYQYDKAMALRLRREEDY